MDLVSRVKGILLTPKNEWAAIDTEPTTVASLYSGFIVPMAAIPAVCTFIGVSIIGVNYLGVTTKLSMASGLTTAVIGFALALVGTYIMALIIDALAPSFGGQKSQIQALKVAAYSSTAVWASGIFALLPTLGVLRILGLYSLYLLFLGLPALMKSPADKSMAYTVVIIICWIILYFVIAAIALAVVGTSAMMVR